MNLTENLTQKTKQEIVELAKIHGMSGISNLKKVELIEKVVDYLTSEQTIREKLEYFTDEDFAFYRKATVSSLELKFNDANAALNMFRFSFGYFEESTYVFHLFDYARSVLELTKYNEFEEQNRKKSWLMKCFRFFRKFYGIAPIEIFYQMYSQKVDCTLHELQQMIEETPVYISELGLIQLEKIENFEQFKETPLHSDHVLLIHTSLFEEEGMEYLAHEQGDINFFIPSVELINEISAKGYEASAPVYKKLRTFFKNKLKFNFEEAEKWCVEVWTAYNENISPIELFENMQRHGIDSKNDKVINELMNIIADAYNNTRVIENRGHTLNEIERYSNFLVDAELE